MRVLSSLAISLALVTLTACAPATSPSPAATTNPTPAKPASATALLKSLGVTEVDHPPKQSLAVPMDGNKTKNVVVNSDEWQPLKSEVSVFSPRAEIFVVGQNTSYVNSSNVTVTTKNYDTYMADAVAGYALSYPQDGGDQAWAVSSAKTSVAADIDGDGISEAIIFYALSKTDTSLYFRVLKGGKLSESQTVAGITLSGKSFERYTAGGLGMGSYWFPYLNCAKARLQTNGQDQILLSDYMSVYIVAVTGSGTRYSASATSSKSYTKAVSTVAAGDINGDHKDDFVVGLQGGSYALYSASFSSPITAPEETSLTGVKEGIEAAFGNFDGDGKTHLALAGVDASGFGQVSMFRFDPTDFKMSVPVATLTVKNNPCGATTFKGDANYYRLLPRAADLTGSGKDQLVVMGNVFVEPMSGNKTGTDGDYDFPATVYIHLENTIVDIEIGDVDNDGKQDMLIQSNGPSWGASFGVYGANSASKRVSEIAKKTFRDPVNGIDQFGTGITVAFGNFEDNAVRVRYEGHALTFTDPILIAVLASPPYYKAIADADAGYAGAFGNWTTTFGTTNTSGKSSTNSVGFSVGASVEFEVEAGFFAVSSSKLSVAVNNSFNWEFAKSYSVSQSITYSCAGGEDRVIFTSVPMDEYRYTVVASNDPENPIGKVMKITIPRAYSTYTVDRDFFNSRINTDITPPVDSKVLQHTLGLPKTYPTSAQKDAILAKAYAESKQVGVYQSEPQALGQGSIPSAGTTNLAIEVTAGSETTFSYAFSVDLAIGTGGGFKEPFGNKATAMVCATAGFQTGYSTSTSSSTSTQFGGTKGYLPTKYFDDPNYSIKEGVFAYPLKDSIGRRFWVVNYWWE